jgi:hypothetical protein
MPASNTRLTPTGMSPRPQSHPPFPLYFPRYVMKQPIHRPERSLQDNVDHNYSIQLLSDNTQLHNMYSKMMAKNLANIHQCDRYEPRYLLA